MEKFAYSIEQLIQEKLRLYKEIYSVFLKEKDYIADMKIEALWDAVSEKKSLAMSLEVVDHKIVSLVNRTYPGLESDPESLTLSRVVQLTNPEPGKKAELERLLMRIDTLKDDIRQQASANSKFINEYLTVISGIFSTILNSDVKPEYGPSRKSSGYEGESRLIRTKV